MLILPSDLFYYLPLRPLALAFVGAAVMRRMTKRSRSSAAVGGIAMAAVRRLWRSDAVRRGLLVAAFNEWIFLRGFVSWARGTYSVAWAQERSTRRPADDGGRP
jgi:hypothetical protein